MKKNITANDLLPVAIAELQNVPEGTVFVVRDLFKGYEWNAYPRDVRLLLGTLFKNYVNNIDVSTELIEMVKTEKGQQKYRKL